ncbi:MAG: NUDIX domain-containing protein [Bacilli bacterium]|nr:NUDIX domain-containing protein [Bacilli bacterium]
MFEVKLFSLEEIKNPELTRVVCITKYNDKLVYVKHQDRNTWELPGGHIEEGETWQEACKREMYEETGAIDIEVEPICYYKISTYGLL